MGIIVDINKKKENVIYSTDGDSIVEVKTSCENLAITTDDNRFHVFVYDGGDSFSRKDLAEFLWAAAMFLDGDKEWFNGDYPCLSKQEGE